MTVNFPLKRYIVKKSCVHKKASTVTNDKGTAPLHSQIVW